jgi:hypothetical protein
MDLNETYARIGDYIKSHPSETYGQIGTTLGLGRGAIARIARLQGIKRRPGKRPSALAAAVAAIEAASPKPDCAPAGEVATPPMEEPIYVAPDAPPVEDALSVTPDTPSAETAVV